MLTHVDKNNQPTMVDISGKKVTARFAQAQAQVRLPEALRSQLKDQELVLKKGPVFQTAIIAGTMAAKKTSDAIPFCHALPLDSCKIKITHDENLLVTILCEVKTTSRSGVEMEALYGASVAALTVYDMVKAVSHDMEILGTRLLKKTGGKNTILGRELYGLVLTGGKSERMQSPKALLNYHGKTQAEHVMDLLNPFCEQVFLSARPGQWQGTELENLPTIYDQVTEGSVSQGPIAGILAAFEQHPEAYWLVVACDLPHLDANAVQVLLQNFDDKKVATCFSNSDEGFPEALCAIYTPAAKDLFQQAMTQGRRCPVKILRENGCHMIAAPSGVNLANINTKKEMQELRHGH